MLTEDQFIKLQEEIISLFDGSENFKEIFDKCRNLISDLDDEDDWMLREFYCDFLSYFFLGGYYKYSEIRDMEEIKNNPFYQEYCYQIKLLDKEDPLYNLYFLTVDLIEKKYEIYPPKATAPAKMSNAPTRFVQVSVMFEWKSTIKVIAM